MTMGYGCAADDCTNPVNWLLTHMNPPGTLSVCDDHAPVFTIGLLAGQLGVDNGGLYDVIKRYVDKQAKLQAAADLGARQAQAAEAAKARTHMGSGQVADDDTESLVFADEGEYIGADGGDDE